MGVGSHGRYLIARISEQQDAVNIHSVLISMQVVLHELLNHLIYKEKTRRKIFNYPEPHDQTGDIDRYNAKLLIA